MGDGQLMQNPAPQLNMAEILLIAQNLSDVAKPMVAPLVREVSAKVLKQSMNSETRVRNTNTGSSVHSQKLWKKYGQKRVQHCRPDDAGVMYRIGFLKRAYYKCFYKNCPAKMFVDIDEQTNKEQPAVVTGFHVHTFEILEDENDKNAGDDEDEAPKAIENGP